MKYKQFDPDGNEKRHAQDSEPRCGECVHHKFDRLSPWCDAIGSSTKKSSEPFGWWCRSSDYAGACKHFKRREVP